MKQQKRFEVLTNTYCGGWVNLWTENDQPQTYATEAEAQAEIDDLLEEMPDYDPEDYEIAEVKHEPAET